MSNTPHFVGSKECTVRGVLVSMLMAVTFFATQAGAASWAFIGPSDCKCDGFRTYIGLLVDIPAGQNPTEVCKNTPATINGHFFRGAQQCVTPVTPTWGFFEVGDASCSSRGIDPMIKSCVPVSPTNPECKKCSQRLSCELSVISTPLCLAAP
ncbi:hypothetical protein [Archangium lansingense]|uniref:Secreted protein n=1 Tax=Archangium lansingense TaxID=2995310 RepID=A0ABT3ZXF8_9BACT|nr:hypothetical protein [Archangium lansinium]MCY1074080.1 hypothetical protein [Archangium lansinium]